MAKFTEVRLTLAAFIYGIEIDLKMHIKKYITPFFSDLSFIMPLLVLEMATWS